MTESELEKYNKVKKRIEQLEEELYALFDAQGQKINPVQRIIRTFSITKHCNIRHECEIELTMTDIKVLQDLRQQELNALRMIVEEDIDSKNRERR